MTKFQTEAVARIITFYDSPTVALGIIRVAVGKSHRHFSSDEATSNFLQKEQESFQKRKDAGVKSPENILRNTLDLLQHARVGRVGSSAKSGFHMILWQEVQGRC